MAGTPVSATTPYITVAEFLDRYDLRTIGQLMHDDDTLPMSGDNINLTALLAELENTGTAPGRRLYAILQDASGKLESSALAGERYTPEDLQALTGNQAEYLKRLVADLAVRTCYERRPTLFGPPPTQSQEADAVLNAIAAGTMIFGLQEVMDAGHMTMTTDTPRNVLTRNSMVVQAQGFFGVRANRIPPRGLQ